MQRYMRILTALLLAVHAMVGCCAHHACGAGVDCGHKQATLALHAWGGAVTVDDAFVAHETSHEGQLPPKPCSHGKCTYVAAAAARVDLGSEPCPWTAAALGTVARSAASASNAAMPLNCRTAAVGPSLYVCYCALLI